MFKKIIGILVCFLFITAIVIPCISSNNNITSIIISNIIPVYPGEKIQEAIDNASDNDTIIVYPGVYNETLFINKSITLEANIINNTRPIINCTQFLFGIIVVSPNVNIMGFIINGSIEVTIIASEAAHLTKINNNIINKNFNIIYGTAIYINEVLDDIITNNNISGFEKGIVLSKNSIIYAEQNNFKDVIYDFYNAVNISRMPNIYYGSISKPLNMVITNDKINVASGIYYENLIINKNEIDLIGEDTDTTIIDGGNNPFVINIVYNITDWIFYEDIYIRGFTIQNGARAGILNEYCEECHIIDCKFKNCKMGINYYHTSGGIISDNIITNCEVGIRLEWADNLNIEKNIIDHNALGIYSDTSDIIFISDNDIENCSRWGVLFFRDIAIRQTNEIVSNNFINNRNDAFVEMHRLGECKNRWFANYWDDFASTIFGVHIIRGRYELLGINMRIPMAQFDWNARDEKVRH